MDATYTSKLKDFCGEILEHGGNVYSSFSADTHLVLGVVLQETLDTTTWELCKPSSQYDFSIRRFINGPSVRRILRKVQGR